MALPREGYFELLVESFVVASTAGKHGDIHVRPVAGQSVDTALLVECASAMKDDFPAGTRFRVKAKYSDRKGGTLFLKAPYAWGFSVVE